MEEKIGRNDPCPCGSGKKYKQCCMHKSHRSLKERKIRAHLLSSPKPINLMERSFGSALSDDLPVPLTSQLTENLLPPPDRSKGEEEREMPPPHESQEKPVPTLEELPPALPLPPPPA